MKAQPFEKVLPTCPVCGKGMPEGFIPQLKKDAGLINADLLMCQTQLKDLETEYKYLLKERDEIRVISHQRKKDLEQERFNHINTRIAWDRTCQKLYDLKALVANEDFYNAGLMAERILHNSEIERTRIKITQFAEWASINDWKYYPGDELWRKRWQCQISSNDLYEKFLNHSKDEK